MMQDTDQTATDHPYRTSLRLNIAGSAFEYFVTLLVEGVYLAALSTAIGIPDAVTGIITAFISLGLGFQCFALLYAHKTPVKRWATLLHILNQACFCLLYLVPGLSVPQWAKITVFVALLFAGRIFYNLCYPSIMNWYLSMVPDGERGRFTAKKEIVSLLGSMIYTFLMGLMIDHYTDAGRQDIAFLLCALTLFVLTVLTTLTFVFSREKPVPRSERHRISLGGLLRDRRFLAVVAVSVLWGVANYATTPFYGTYQNNELAFSKTFVAVLAALYSISRALVSHPLGRLADKTSFARMLTLCFLIEAAAYSINMFTVPQNGKVFYAVYYVLHAIGMGGINSGAVNLIYDYVPPSERTGAVALQNTLSGFAGFFTTLAFSPLVSYIQGNGNYFLGVPLYAQQVLSAFGLIVSLFLVFYLRAVIAKVPRYHCS